MKIAYFDCFCGAAGDMIVGACLDGGAKEDKLRQDLQRLGLENVEIKIEKICKNGIAATRFQPIVKDKSKTEHRTLSMIIDIIDRAGFSELVSRQAVDIFQRLAQAEAKVHDTTEDKIHFHEVGADDAIMDIVGSCAVLEQLEVEKIYCSPLVVGSGMTTCEHGTLPVPAPATAELIKGIETLPTDVRMELLTPTGAAILTSLAESFGPMPPLRITNIGYGAGQREIPGRSNVLRLLVGQSSRSGSEAEVDQVCVLETNIDDASAELIGHVTEKLLAAGALEVFCTAVTMKKNRPGSQITVLCSADEIQKIERLLFQESTTFGIRRHFCQRSILPRENQTVTTPFGDIRIKLGYLNGQVTTRSVEFGDCQKAAEKHKVSVKEVIAATWAAYQQKI